MKILSLLVVTTLVCAGYALFTAEEFARCNFRFTCLFQIFRQKNPTKFPLTTQRPTTARQTTKPTPTTIRTTRSTPTTTRTTPSTTKTTRPTPTTAKTTRPITVTQPQTPAPTTPSSTSLPGTTSELLTKLPALKAELNQLMDRNKNLIPAWVQLGFHTCVGGCDGCLQSTHGHNKGLIGTYADLKDLHKKHSAFISLADFVVLASSEAAKKGISKGNHDVEIRFRVGRKTCSNPDNSNKIQNLPDGDNPKASAMLQREFGLTDVETVALLGAHSLGRCKLANSGFEGPWDNSPDVLDTGYYKSLLGTAWVPGHAPGGALNGVNQWNGANRMMLHADMGLLKEFSVSGPEKIPSCTFNTCPAASNAAHVRAFAGDTDVFLETFVTAFQKMIEKSNETLRDL